MHTSYRRDETKRVKFLRLLILWLTMAVVIVGVSFLAHGKAHAADVGEPEIGQGLVCDTPEQITAFITESETNGSENAQTISDTRFGKTACVIMAVAYIKGESVSEMSVKTGIIHVTHITLIGVRMPQGWIKLKEPLEQFTAILVPAKGV